MNIKNGLKRRWNKWSRKINYQYRILTSRKRKLPEFIIIGTQKGGTTSLFACLKQHPQIAMSRRKELHFFNTNFDKGLSWYRRFFPFKNSPLLAGEVTPCYLFHPEAAARMKVTIPDAKLIVMLRNPIDRAYSSYIMSVDFDWDDAPNFEAAIEQEKKLKEKESAIIAKNPSYFSIEKDHLFYLERSKYYEQLQVWLKHFKREQFLFLKSEDFFSHPQKELTKVFDFLGVDAIYPSDLKARNARQYDALSDGLREKLSLYFEEHNTNLANLLGENFEW
ncbi:MAG: sulfotransferase [Bacteroidota bacterium]